LRHRLGDGQIKVTVPENLTDDRVMSLALAVGVHSPEVPPMYEQIDEAEPLYPDIEAGRRSLRAVVYGPLSAAEGIAQSRGWCVYVGPTTALAA
jgi:hypothetical protein